MTKPLVSDCSVSFAIGGEIRSHHGIIDRRDIFPSFCISFLAKSWIPNGVSFNNPTSVSNMIEDTMIKTLSLFRVSEKFA